MIEKENFKKIVYQKLQSLKEGEYLDIRSYKRNRSILIVKLKNSYRFIENGFRNMDVYLNNLDDVKSALKTTERVEFPRSHMVRIYKMDNFDETKINLQRKKL
ncbi:hypothetical protein SAMN05660835_01086 [Desulfurella multipotens]|uniref:Uncharacterized protein n=1 Tax=Desulfurella multipotens TaxID=79269 RepID=A0A1G6N1X1_9BACT|nr:hypothetical protein [Desulfurella multipotens]SDC61701.1 hypothetical protein SAMN05660835_01086 [Desulfurella multipotens]